MDNKVEPKNQKTSLTPEPSPTAKPSITHLADTPSTFIADNAAIAPVTEPTSTITPEPTATPEPTTEQEASTPTPTEPAKEPSTEPEPAPTSAFVVETISSSGAPENKETSSVVPPVDEISANNPVYQAPHRWIKPLRFFLWIIIVIALTIGFSLYSRGRTSSAYANGTADALQYWGKIVFYPALALTVLNFIWGAVRWFKRWHREGWGIGRVIGKLIGGGIWRTLAIGTLAIVSFLFIAPFFYRTVSKNVISARGKELDTSTSRLELAYTSGELDSDTYLNYVLDSLYSPESLPNEYRGTGEINFLPDYLDFADEHLSELSNETIARVLERSSLPIEFSTDASNNTAKTNSLFSTPAYAATDVATLNKAMLSPNEHFVIFYTDTGADKISNAEIENLGVLLERVIENYESKLGLKYEYELFPKFAGDSNFANINNAVASAQKRLLRENGIDENITETAMAVYVIDPYDESASTLASYAGRKFLETGNKLISTLGILFMSDETHKLYASTPAYPFVNIRTSKVSDPNLELIVAHELGHHYASNYCYATYGKQCNSDNKFISETAPNWFAVNVVDNVNQISNNVMERHYNYYIDTGTCNSISTVIIPADCNEDRLFKGYPAYAFLQNYSEIVPNATNIFLEAMTKEDTFTYLYNQAGPDNYRKIMTKLTERNLLNNYAIPSLHANNLPTGESVPCTDVCGEAYHIEPSSSRYIYFLTEEYAGTKLSFTSADFINTSILGQKDGRWTLITELDNIGEYDMANAVDNNYDMIVFAITNFSSNLDGNFILHVTAEELDELIDEDKLDLDINNLPIYAISNNCIGADFDGVIDLPVKIINIIRKFDTANDYTNIIEQMQSNNAITKERLDYHYMTLCSNVVKPDVSFDTVRAAIKLVAKPSIEVFHINNPDDQISVIGTANLATQETKLYLLGRLNGELKLITFHMYNKIAD